MAAGLGFKTFTTGEVLTAADTNGYLMQGINVFATTAARDAAITSPQEGQFAYTKDTNSLWYYTGSAWAASGATGDIEGVTAGTGISGGGTSGTVTITNSMATAIDAKGDLIGGTGADAFSRLAVGANNTVLTADSAEATGLKWATPAAGGGGLVFISRTSFTNAASQAFDSVFTSTYKVYCAVIEDLYNASDNTGDLQLQFRYAGPTTQTLAYYGSAISTSYLNTTVTSTPSSNIAAAILATTSTNSNYPGQGQIYFGHVGNSSQKPTYFGNFTELNDNNSIVSFGGNNDTARTYTGFLLKASAGTGITGTVSIYGLATS